MRRTSSALGGVTALSGEMTSPPASSRTWDSSPLPGERRDLFDRGIEAGAATGDEGIEVGVDGQRQRPALA